jgi:hypothetical protein
MALGADKGKVLRLFIGQELKLVLGGIAVGQFLGGRFTRWTNAFGKNWGTTAHLSSASRPSGSSRNLHRRNTLLRNITGFYPGTISRTGSNEHADRAISEHLRSIGER